MVRPDPGERVRSVQLYGVDPLIAGRAVRILVERDLADHIDLNFGCPAPKVTRRGGGAALPWKRDLLAAILRDYRPITPDRDERFERGDELIFLTAREGESSLKELPLIFT